MALDTLIRGSIVAADQICVRDVSANNDREVLITREEFIAATQVINAGTVAAIPIAGGTVVMTKTSASAFTLAAPTALQAGTRMRFINGSAFAHVITATGLIDDGVTGGAKNTATFGAFVGSALELEAYGLHWTVVNKNVCTIA